MFANSMNFEITVRATKVDYNLISGLKRIDGVSELYPAYSTYNVEVNDGEKKIMQLIGIDKNRYFDYWKINVDGSLENFDQGRNK